MTLEGHGYGHGHGMGQWGALGYALAGTGYQSIVDHYYGGTALAGLSAAQEATQVRVALTENDGNTVIVTSGSPFTVAGGGLAGRSGPGRAHEPGRGRSLERLCGLGVRRPVAGHPPPCRTSPIPPPTRLPTRASVIRQRRPRPSSCARAEAT